MKDGATRGVVLRDGTEIHGTRVASGVDANVTFLKLMSNGDLPAEFVEAVRHIDYSSASCKINIALSELPDFTAVPGTQPRARSIAAPSTSRPRWSTSSGPTTTPSTASPRQHPIIEATIPSALDDTLAPAGEVRDVDVHPVLPVQAGAGTLAGRRRRRSTPTAAST